MKKSTKYSLIKFVVKLEEEFWKTVYLSYLLLSLLYSSKGLFVQTCVDFWINTTNMCIFYGSNRVTTRTNGLTETNAVFRFDELVEGG